MTGRRNFRYCLIGVAAAVLAVSGDTALANEPTPAAPSSDGADAFRAAAASFTLTHVINSSTRQAVTADGRLVMSYSFEPPANARRSLGPQSDLVGDDVQGQRLRSARLVAQVSSGASFGIALFDGLDRLVAELRESSKPSFLVAGDPLDDIGFVRHDQTALALRQDFAGWGITASVEDAEAAGSGAADYRRQLDRRRKPASASRYGLAIDRDFGPLLLAAGASWLAEDQTILGTRVRDGFHAGGADSVFFDGALSWYPHTGWRVGAAWRHGITRSSIAGVAATGLSFTTNAWAFDATRWGVFGESDSVSLRISQPLRVAGEAGVGLPLEYSYEMRGEAHVATSVTLAPTGREIAGELNWRGPILGGWATTGLFYRKDPGHFANLPDDHGAAFSWAARF